MLARAPVVTLGPTNKSFLLLFFKKQVLPFFLAALVAPTTFLDESAAQRMSIKGRLPC
jgi:hypothetical protein